MALAEVLCRLNNRLQAMKKKNKNSQEQTTELE